MKTNELVAVSRFMCFILRHVPEKAGIVLDKNGWADAKLLLEGINKVQGRQLTLDDLNLVVDLDNKQRFSFNDDGSKIRANQGHSVTVDVELAAKQPPAILYHGTAYKSISSIKRTGLKPRSRLLVHLSVDVATAVSVGKRHGTPKVLVIDAAQMHEDGYTFYLSENGVWLVSQVELKYIDFGFEHQQI